MKILLGLLVLAMLTPGWALFLLGLVFPVVLLGLLALFVAATFVAVVTQLIGR